jgi:hypothetical protein
MLAVSSSRSLDELACCRLFHFRRTPALLLRLAGLEKKNRGAGDPCTWV